MKIGIIGSGDVGRTLAAGFLRHGHEVVIGTRDAKKLAEWSRQNPKAGLAETAKASGVIVLAVKGTAASESLAQAGDDNLAGKVVIDATNPISDSPPVNGVLAFFTDPRESLMERLQRGFPRAHLVKAFNSVGASCMVNPAFKGGPPTMFIAGNDAKAKATVGGILEQFGWETEDMGAAEAARAIEPLAILWCIPGFWRDDWVHAFKLLR
ncbi:MAG TPA: NAD(P)-binding domain-containing protein [Opitutaceae bacterium]|jgi:hypothetical protein